MNKVQEYQAINEEQKNEIRINNNNSNNQIGDLISQTKQRSHFIRLLGYSLKHKYLLFIGNFSLLITSLSMIAIPYLTGKIIDSITSSESNDELNSLSFSFILMSLITAAFTFTREYCYHLLSDKIVFDLRNDLFQKLIHKDIEFFDSNRSGELLSRLSSDVQVIQKGAGDSISMLIKNVVQFVGSLFLLWFISWNLTLVLFCVIPPFAILVINFIRSFKKLMKEHQKSVAESTQIASEVLGNMRIVRSFSTEQKESQIYEKATLKTYNIGIRLAKIGSIFMSCGIVLGYGVILAILYYGGSLVIKGDLSVGDLSSFVLYTLTMTFSLFAVSGTMNTIISAAAVAEKIFNIIDHPIKVKNGNKNSDNITGEIILENVSFAYPTKQNVITLKSVNLEVKKGEVIAFVGQSGSGKSTIVSLLERFYDCNNGKILFDSIDIKEYNLQQLHKTIGFVAQEPTLFSGTLLENITYGVDQFTQEDVDNALRLANAYEFTSNKHIFPDGLQTIVGERGIKLSGGQKQRIAIARALIKNPKILIFDEATSALDSESEFQVQQAIDGLVQSGQKTIIIIAHRLSTIINSNKILVIQNGEVVEQGTHQVLIEKNGVYKQLIERQLT